MDKFIGCLVSLNCGETLGLYQGKVESINTENNTLTISKTFRNGVPHTLSHVTLRSQDIKDLKIIKNQDEIAEITDLTKNVNIDLDNFPHFIKDVTVHSNNNTPIKNYRPSPISTPHRYQNSSRQGNYYDNYQNVDSNNYNEYFGNTYLSKKHPYTNAKVIASFSDHTNSSTKNLKHYSQQYKNLECFQKCEGDFEEEFDFEHNLSLFNKLTNKVNSNEASVTNNNKEQKYKCDENVIKGIYTSYRQITYYGIDTNPLDSGIKGEYKTDMGFIVPGISKTMRDAILKSVVSDGFSLARVVESYGRSISEAVMQYLGGSVRFEPKNAHQKPSIVFLLSTTCHPWISASAISCARHISNRSAHVKILLVSSQSPPSPVIKDELNLFTATTTGEVVKDFKDLSLDHGVDLIISTLSDTNENSGENVSNISYKETDFDFKTNKIFNKLSTINTPIFAIEPSANMTLLHYKRSFVSVLPVWLSQENFGQICYCDLGIPDKLFMKAGFSYKSPFFDRFFLTLHPQDQKKNAHTKYNSKN